MAVEAVWNGAVIAHSDCTVVLGGNPYFPREDFDMALLGDGATSSECSWKGAAHSYTLALDGDRATDAARFCPDPMPEADKARDNVAFRNRVEVGAG